jgi:hypothetical protein
MDAGHIIKPSQECGEKLLDVLTTLLVLFKLHAYHCPTHGRIVYTFTEHKQAHELWPNELQERLARFKDFHPKSTEIV